MKVVNPQRYVEKSLGIFYKIAAEDAKNIDRNLIELKLMTQVQSKILSQKPLIEDPVMFLNFLILAVKELIAGNSIPMMKQHILYVLQNLKLDAYMKKNIELITA